MPLSQSPFLSYLSHLVAVLFIGFGANAILRPANALTFLEYHTPASTASDRDMVDALMAVYGIRDVFMGIVISVAALTGTRKSLGWTLVAASAVAFGDGAIVRVAHAAGGGEWSHWGYAPMVLGLGVCLAGLFD